MQRRKVDLPEPDGPRMHMHLAGLHLERDALQHLEAAEALVHALGLDHRRAHRRSPDGLGHVLGRGGRSEQQAAPEPLQRRLAACPRAAPRPKWRSR